MCQPLEGRGQKINVIQGHWGSAAFVAVVFAAAILFCFRFPPLDDLDDEVSAIDTEAGPEDPVESHTADRPT